MEDTMRHESAPTQARTQDYAGLSQDMVAMTLVNNSLEFKTRENENLLASTQRNFKECNTPLKLISSLNQDSKKRRVSKLPPLKNLKIRTTSELGNKTYLKIYASPTTEDTEKLSKQNQKVRIRKAKRNSPSRPRPIFKIDEIGDQQTISTPDSKKGEVEKRNDSLDTRVEEKSAFLNTSNFGFGPQSQLTSTNSIFESLSIRNIRKSRLKIEEDVNRLHNRVRLLIHEEERALKLIQETRDKAENILRLKIESQQFKQQLATVRESYKQAKTDLVRKRNFTAKESSTFNDTTYTSRSNANELQKKKMDDVQNLKNQMSQALKKAQKKEKRNLQAIQSRRNDILFMEHQLKEQQENIVLQKSTSVRKYKETQIKNEIFKIHKKNNEAKSLVKEEHKILSRLKETQNLQKETIQHIKELFYSLNQELTPHQVSGPQLLNQTSRFLESSLKQLGIVEERESLKSHDKDD